VNLKYEGNYRISRFHDEKGNFVDPSCLLNALPAFFSAAAKRLFNLQPKVPMISYQARKEIEWLLTPKTRMIEFGSGNSTPWFASRTRSVISIEDDASWYSYVQERLASLDIQNVQYELRTKNTYASLGDVPNASVDFAFIDGTDRAGCIHSVIPKLKEGAYLYLNNTDKDMTIPDGDFRRAEAALLEAVDIRQGSVRYFSDFSPTNFFVEQGVLAQF